MSTTYDNTNLGGAVGNLESILMGASIVSADKTPVLSTNKRTSASAVKEEWLMDDLPDPITTAAIEGKDATVYDDPFARLGRAYNYVQRNDRTATITVEQAAVKKASSQDQADILLRTTTDLNVDVEASILSANARAWGDGSNQGRTMAGLANMLNPSSSVWADNLSLYAPTAAQFKTNTDPTEAGVNELLATLFALSGETNRLRVYGHVNWIRKYTTEALRTDAGTSKLRVNHGSNDTTLRMQVKVFQSDFGTIEIFTLNPRTCTRTALDTAYFLNPDFIEIKTLGKPISVLPQGNAGGGEKWVLQTMNTIINRNPRTSAYWQAGS